MMISIMIASLLLIYGHAAAHEKGKQGFSQSENDKIALEISVTINHSEPAQVIAIQRGTNIRLSIHGAGNHELHLHGYDIIRNAETKGPAVFEFEALHTGRFAIVIHDTDDLLGRKEKVVVYIEIRGP